jgi:hypothetical protein
VTRAPPRGAAAGRRARAHRRDLHHPADIAQRIELPVVEIARMIAQRADAGMRGDDRAARKAGRLHHRRARGVRDIDHDAEPVHLADRAAPERTQPAVLLRRVAEIGARIGGIGQLVMAVMGEREIDRAQFAQAGELAGIAADGIAVLHRRDHRDHAGAPRRLDIPGAADYAGDEIADAAVHATDRLQHATGTRPGGGVAGLIARPLRDIGGETPGREPATAHLRQIDAAGGVGEWIVLGRVLRRPGDVDMAVEGQQGTVQLCGFAHRFSVSPR